MKQSAETITAVDISGEVGRWGDQRTTRSGRNEAQRPRWTVTIVQLDNATPPLPRLHLARAPRTGARLRCPPAPPEAAPHEWEPGARRSAPPWRSSWFCPPAAGGSGAERAALRGPRLRSAARRHFSGAPSAPEKT